MTCGRDENLWRWKCIDTTVVDEGEIRNKYSINLIYSTRSMFSHSLHPFSLSELNHFFMGLTQLNEFIFFPCALHVVVFSIPLALIFRDLCWAFSRVS